jgi:hypothetical protein
LFIAGAVLLGFYSVIRNPREGGMEAIKAIELLS